jgi:hypothetical protein
MEKEPQYEIEGVDDKRLKKNKGKKHENEEERIGLQKCSLDNITKNGMEKNGPLPFLCFFLEVFTNQHPLSLSLSLFLYIFFTSFWNCSTMNTSYYLSFLFLLFIVFFLVFFTSCLEVFATKHPLSRLFFSIIVMEK